MTRLVTLGDRCTVALLGVFVGMTNPPEDPHNYTKNNANPAEGLP